MPLQIFEISLDDSTYQAALRRAQSDDQPLEQILAGLVTAYARGEAGAPSTYTVQSGDTLATIARQVYGDPYKYPVIQNANNIGPTGQIRVGQVLLIPFIAGTRPVSPPPVKSIPLPTPTPPPSPPTPTPTPPPAVSPPIPQPEPTPSPPPSTEPTLADYMRAMPTGFRPDQAGSLQVTYQFQLSGPGGGTWTVVVANQNVLVTEGQTAPPSVVIGMSGPDFIQLSQGRLNTIQAYQQGRIQISGDINLATRIPEIFEPWSGAVAEAPTPPPSPPPPAPTPTPSPQPEPPPSDAVYPSLMNASFDEYQPYHREDEDKVWKEPQFPERYAKYWTLELISERKRRIHLMDSGTFGKFAQKYFGGSGLNYSPHSGQYSQVITSRYGFDLVLMQTVAAQPNRDYTFTASIVSFYKGTGGEQADGKVFKRIGIDPTGGRDWRGDHIVWSERDGTDNKWRYPNVRATAKANAITLFFRFENVEKDVGETELNIIHLDDCKLE